MEIVDALEEVQLKRLAEAMDNFNVLAEELCGTKCNVVLTISRSIGGSANAVTVMSKLDPEIVGPILWQALGDVQMLLKSKQPPSNAVH